MDYHSIFITNENSPEDLIIYCRVQKKFEPQIKNKENGESFTSHSLSVHVSNAVEWLKTYRRNYTAPTDSKNLLFPIYVPEYVYNSVNEGDCILIQGGIYSDINKNNKEVFYIKYKSFRNNNLYSEKIDKDFEEIVDETQVFENKKTSEGEVLIEEKKEEQYNQNNQIRKPGKVRKVGAFDKVIINNKAL